MKKELVRRLRKKKMIAVAFVWLGNIEQLNGDWNLDKFEQSALHNYF